MCVEDREFRKTMYADIEVWEEPYEGMHIKIICEEQMGSSYLILNKGHMKMDS